VLDFVPDGEPDDDIGIFSGQFADEEIPVRLGSTLGIRIKPAAEDSDVDEATELSLSSSNPQVLRVRSISGHSADLEAVGAGTARLAAELGELEDARSFLVTEPDGWSLRLRGDGAIRPLTSSDLAAWRGTYRAIVENGSEDTEKAVQFEPEDVCPGDGTAGDSRAVVGGFVLDGNHVPHYSGREIFGDAPSEVRVRKTVGGEEVSNMIVETSPDGSFVVEHESEEDLDAMGMLEISSEEDPEEEPSIYPFVPDVDELVSVAYFMRGYERCDILEGNTCTYERLEDRPGLTPSVKVLLDFTPRYQGDCVANGTSDSHTVTIDVESDSDEVVLESILTLDVEGESLCTDFPCTIPAYRNAFVVFPEGESVTIDVEGFGQSHSATFEEAVE
jgi:hypothetical protein